MGVGGVGGVGVGGVGGVGGAGVGGAGGAAGFLHGVSLRASKDFSLTILIEFTCLSK